MLKRSAIHLCTSAGVLTILLSQTGVVNRTICQQVAINRCKIAISLIDNDFGEWNAQAWLLPPGYMKKDGILGRFDYPGRVGGIGGLSQ
jgi:hypothetical protein